MWPLCRKTLEYDFLNASHLVSSLSGPEEKQSVDLSNNADAHQNLLSFLAVVNVQMSLAFKRTKLSPDAYHSRSTAEDEHRVYRALISELMVLEYPAIKKHPSVLELDGMCWEIPKTKSKVFPVLVFEKAPFEGPESYLLSEHGRLLNFTERHNVCADYTARLS